MTTDQEASSNPEPSSGSNASSAPLYDPLAVGIATFVGAPIAGATLMALNYRRLGEQGKGKLTLLVGGAVTGLALWLGTLVPNYDSIPFSLILILSMRVVAGALQGRAVAEHVSQGGRIGSRWKASGIGLVWLCVIVLVVFAPLYWLSVRNRVLVGARDEVFFTGQATRHDAEMLGEALKKNGYFEDKGASVFLSKDRDGITLSLVEQQGVWDQPDMLLAGEEVASEVAPAIGGFPVRVQLMNVDREVKKEGVAGCVPLGKDEIFYFGNVQESEARALGKALVEDGYFQNTGATVRLARDSQGTVLSFVVADGVWEYPEQVSEFEAITKEVSPLLGGLPMTLRFEDTTLETEKELVVK